ncbi:MAG TPA: ATP-binding cassette domain-containing protein, partial [Actinomycetales bacterium]
MDSDPGLALEVTALSPLSAGHALLDAVTLRVGRGERVALLGASGSGKSLTAAAVVGQLPVGLTTSGSVRVAGHEVLGVPVPRRAPAARAAMVSQDSSTALHPLVRVGDQVALALHRQG